MPHLTSTNQLVATSITTCSISAYMMKSVLTTSIMRSPLWKFSANYKTLFLSSSLHHWATELRKWTIWDIYPWGVALTFSARLFLVHTPAVGRKHGVATLSYIYKSYPWSLWICLLQQFHGNKFCRSKCSFDLLPAWLNDCQLFHSFTPASATPWRSKSCETCDEGSVLSKAMVHQYHVYKEQKWNMHAHAANIPVACIT